ncbi:MAG: putative membrane protein YfcA [Candidatus Omnitrophota bacterium]|jgi:uncharacterized membrane protein YfcA
MQALPLWLPIAFFCIALFYSMVGFGGGSSYLAILTLAGISYEYIPAQALICNIVVAGGGFWHFYRAGHFKAKRALPWVVLSIPMAYLGGRIQLNEAAFCTLLGLALLVVAIYLVYGTRQRNCGSSELIMGDRTRPPRVWSRRWLPSLIMGAGLGLLAGIVGIGGGIFLSPLLLCLGWADSKEAASTASFFILANSLAGLMGHMHKGGIILEYILPLALVVFIGGQIGSRLGAYHLSKKFLKYSLAALVFYVSIRLLMRSI